MHPPSEHVPLLLLGFLIVCVTIWVLWHCGKNPTSTEMLCLVLQDAHMCCAWSHTHILPLTGQLLHMKTSSSNCVLSLDGRALQSKQLELKCWSLKACPSSAMTRHCVIPHQLQTQVLHSAQALLLCAVMLLVRAQDLKRAYMGQKLQRQALWLVHPQSVKCSSATSATWNFLAVLLLSPLQCSADFYFVTEFKPLAGISLSVSWALTGGNSFCDSSHSSSFCSSSHFSCLCPKCKKNWSRGKDEVALNVLDSRLEKVRTTMDVKCNVIKSRFL